MFRRSKNKSNSDYRINIPEYSDEKIVEILKMRDHYQKDAANLAIKEAIKRGILFSEQDLFSEEYHVEPLEFSLFPNIHRKRNKENIRKSIARSFVIAGVIPLVYGILQLNQGKNSEGIVLLISGVMWILLSGQLIKTYLRKNMLGLCCFILLGIIYLVWKLSQLKGLGFFDYFIPFVSVVLISYGLYFIKILHVGKDS